MHIPPCAEITRSRPQIMKKATTRELWIKSSITQTTLAATWRLSMNLYRMSSIRICSICQEHTQWHLLKTTQGMWATRNMWRTNNKFQFLLRTSIACIIRATQVPSATTIRTCSIARQDRVLAARWPVWAQKETSSSEVARCKEPARSRASELARGLALWLTIHSFSSLLPIFKF